MKQEIRSEKGTRCPKIGQQRDRTECRDFSATDRPSESGAAGLLSASASSTGTWPGVGDGHPQGTTLGQQSSLKHLLLIWESRVSFGTLGRGRGDLSNHCWRDTDSGCASGMSPRAVSSGNRAGGIGGGGSRSLSRVSCLCDLGAGVRRSVDPAVACPSATISGTALPAEESSGILCQPKQALPRKCQES